MGSSLKAEETASQNGMALATGSGGWSKYSSCSVMMATMPRLFANCTSAVRRARNDGSTAPSGRRFCSATWKRMTLACQ